MAKYLFEASYTVEGTKGLLHEGGTGRRAAIEKMLGGLGGKIIDMYFAFGDVDVYVIADLPDNVSAAAAALAVNHSGGATVKTVVLMSLDEVDKACHKTVSYRPPA
jgi:uncharacterized protein with GYD domain